MKHLGEIPGGGSAHYTELRSGADGSGTDHPNITLTADQDAPMKAIAYQQALPIADPRSLQEVDLPAPQLRPRDLLVDVQAIAVNPVDTKVRAGVNPEPGQWKVLGWDAVGQVRAVGAEVTLFKPGDRVWYAGAINRAGANAEQHVVDERIVALAPASLTDADAAALPLTAITAWEMLFHRLGVSRGEAGKGQSLLIIGAAGGVGSIMTQLARQLTGLTVIGTASRPETAQWVGDLGAHHVLDHAKPLADEIQRAGLAAPEYVVSLTQTPQHFAQIAKLIAPQGKFGLIDDPVAGSIDIGKLKPKSVSLHWEAMFARSLFETPDMIEQHRLLTEVAQHVDAGQLRSTRGEHFGKIDAANLRRAHALLESGKARGKIVLEGF
jgi:zinc-binding alcohol dehydrogenase family protein